MQPPQLNSRAAGSCAWRPWLLRLSSGRPAALAGWRRRTHAAGAGPAQPAMPLGVAAQAAAAAAAPEVDAPPAPGPPGSEASEAAVAESFTLLEWPALCGQVACFTQTTAGAEVALSCRLPIGRTQAESEQMLQETAEAQRADLMCVAWPAHAARLRAVAEACPPVPWAAVPVCSCHNLPPSTSSLVALLRTPTSG